MTTRQQRARAAVAAALHFRAISGSAPWQAVCPIELAHSAGIEVRFVDIPSLEGMYWKRSNPVILLGAERPPGRQAFTCAHELGHHHFQHGTKIDEVLDGGERLDMRDQDEYVAEVFAGFLLMSKSAVDRAFAVRGIAPHNATTEQVFTVANSLGVGYRALIRHLQLSLQSISSSRAKELLRETPKAIRTAILAASADSDLVVVDEHWDPNRAIDLQVGDFAVLSAGATVEGAVAAANPEDYRVVIRAVRPGIARAAHGNWAAFLRVSRRRFVGRAAFRHLEDPDD